MRYVLLIALSCITFSQIKFQDYFFYKTLRFDYIHAGSSSKSLYYFDKMKEEPHWGGSLVNLVDTLNLGDYLFKIVDSASSKTIYSRGYSTLFYEWQTTREADSISRSMKESLVFPFPKKSAALEIYERDSLNNFFKVYEFNFNPENYFIVKDNYDKFKTFEFHKSGDPSVSYDIVILPEGYRADEMDKFKAAAEKMIQDLWNFEPFVYYKDKINIWGVEAPSPDSSVDIPKDTVWKNTLMDFTYYTFDSERYLMTENFQSVRDIAAYAPYDNIYILVNSDKYGGGAIYNFYCATAAENKMAKEVFVHELGHGLAALADEYYDSSVSYEDFFNPEVEPWQKNITTLVNFESKWKDMVDENTPIPTPIETEYKYLTGVFEGGGYVKKGVYRPSYNSIMKSLSLREFNKPSIKTIQSVLEFYIK